MKKNIKTNLKLAGVCASTMMTLSGCAWDTRNNVIENISDSKFLVKDIKDGTERILLFDQQTKSKVKEALPYFRVGDTIQIDLTTLSTYHYYYERCLNMSSDLYRLYVPQYLIKRRKHEEHLREQQQQFDTLKQIMMQKQDQR